MPIAIYHFHVKIVSRGKGKSAVAAAAYISGEKIKNEYDSIVHDFRKKKEIVHKEILLPDTAPQNFKKRSILWNAVEKSETRKTSQTARDIDAALPVELSRAEQIDLVRNFCNQCFVSSGMCVDFAIHDKNDGNPHVHILLTTRHVDANGFTTKDRSWNDRDLLKVWRERWADWCNHKLYSISDERIDHRSYAEQGIEKVPQLHLGAAACAIEKKGFKTDKGSRNRKIQLINLDSEIANQKNDIDEFLKEQQLLKKEILEVKLGCPFSEIQPYTADIVYLTELETELKNQNVPCHIAKSSSKGTAAIFFPKSSIDKVTEVWNMIEEKKKHPVTIPTTEPDKPKKKPRSR
ncbi:MAG: MobA/MobL family protein [Ruminococcus sp.]|nr:MobA/MobL family protein [Ruminococcus sp.]